MGMLTFDAGVGVGFGSVRLWLGSCRVGGSEVNAIAVPSRLMPLYRKNWRVSQALKSRSTFPLLVASVQIGRTIFTKVNSSKTSPTQKFYSKGLKECQHAEVALLTRFVGEDLHGPLLVTKWGRSAKKFTMSRPCRSCTWFLQTHFPHLEVVYIDRAGDLAWLDLGVPELELCS